MPILKKEVELRLWPFIEEASMRNYRFGRRIRLPSTVAIKHQLLTLMLEDEIRAMPPGELFNEKASPALGMLRQLVGVQTPRDRAG